MLTGTSPALSAHRNSWRSPAAAGECMTHPLPSGSVISLSSPHSPVQSRRVNESIPALQGLVDLTWHAQLNCQRSRLPDRMSGPLIRGGSDGDPTSSPPNRSVGIVPHGAIVKTTPALRVCQECFRFFSCGSVLLRAISSSVGLLYLDDGVPFFSC